MQKEFYSLPLSLENIMEKKAHKKCNLQQSVAQNLHLILTTAFGELQSDKSFGCGIWDDDFDNITSRHKQRETIKQSLTQSIKDHEKRIENVKIEIVIHQQELNADINGRRVKKRMDVSITGRLKLTNEKLEYNDSFFVSPLSYY